MRDYSERSDEELIRILRNGEERVTEYLMNKYKPLVRSKANAMFLIGGETEDLLQEGMIGLFKALRDYREDKDSSFFHFAEICIQRQLYKAVQSSTRKKHTPLNNYVSMSRQEVETSVEQMLYDEKVNPEYLVLEQEEIRHRMELLTRQLSPMENRVLRMYLRGFGYVQIAEAMEKSPKAIDNALQRIHQKIQKLDET